MSNIISYSWSYRILHGHTHSFIRLDVSVEQTLLSWFILRRAPGGVTPSTISYMTDEHLAKVHWTPSVTCGAPLRSLSCSPWREPLEILTLRGSQETHHLHLTLRSGVWAPLAELISFPWREPLRSQPCVDHKRHGTYIIHYSLGLIHSWEAKPIHADSFTSDPWSIRLAVNYPLVHTYHMWRD